MIRNPNDIQEGAKKIRMLIAGYPGIGKSTLALSAPNPLHIDVDFGIDRIEPRYRKPYIQPQSYDEILGDLTEGQILIIIEVEAGALLLRQKLTVVIVEQRHRQRVVLHAECLLSGVWPLQLRYHTGFLRVCQVKSLSDAETDKKFYLHFEHIMLTWGIHI